jgi:hypothetical protein
VSARAGHGWRRRIWGELDWRTEQDHWPVDAMRCGVPVPGTYKGDGLSPSGAGMVVGGTGVPRLTERELKPLLRRVEFVSRDRFQIGF